MSQSQPARKPPNLWGVASVTYGAVIAVTIISIVAYYYLAPKRTVSQQLTDAERSMAVGSVWMPIYPGALVESSSASALLDTVRDGDLLVLGSRGRGAVASRLFGSTVNSVVDQAAVPVVVVREGA